MARTHFQFCKPLGSALPPPVSHPLHTHQPIGLDFLPKQTQNPLILTTSSIPLLAAWSHPLHVAGCPPPFLGKQQDNGEGHAPSLSSLLASVWLAGRKLSPELLALAVFVVSLQVGLPSEFACSEDLGTRWACRLECFCPQTSMFASTFLPTRSSSNGNVLGGLL